MPHDMGDKYYPPHSAIKTDHSKGDVKSVKKPSNAGVLHHGTNAPKGAMSSALKGSGKGSGKSSY